jgi:hypothetical protein
MTLTSLSISRSEDHPGEFSDTFQSPTPVPTLIISCQSTFYILLLFLLLQTRNNSGEFQDQDLDVEDAQPNFISHAEFELKLDVPFKVNLKEF